MIDNKFFSKMVNVDRLFIIIGIIGLLFLAVFSMKAHSKVPAGYSYQVQMITGFIKSMLNFKNL